MMSFFPREDITSWGRVVRKRQCVARPAFISDVIAWAAEDKGRRLAAGLRRSYGDTPLFSDGRLILTPELDRILSFDERGLVRAQAGLSLGELLKIAVPRGWFAPVTPGTKNVTLGGAVANDVHGKNHTSAGTFGCHVRAITLLRSDAGIVEITSDSHPQLFAATIGGLGLTGVILDVTLQLAPIRSASLEVERLPLAKLDDFVALNEESLGRWEHTVAWIDCTRQGAKIGAGVYSRANWSAAGDLAVGHELRRMLPVETPGFLINRLSLTAFNRLYRAVQLAGPRQGREHFSKFFYPLDSVQGWNKLYGRAGFYQYQCVLPFPGARDGLAEMLAAIGRSGEGSALVVLKTFGGVRSPGMLSFPRPGLTLALDFRNRGRVTASLLATLDRIVESAGGALYPAKDGRMSRHMFELSFPEFPHFSRFRDPACGSDFMSRIGL